MRNIHPAVYIITNKRKGILYVGVTSDLIKRAYQHKHPDVECFTKRYGCNQLVYYEQHEDMLIAIEREKIIKGGSRKKKIMLIEKNNPKWLDLYETLL